MYLKFFGLSLWLALTRRFDAIHAGRALPEGLVAWLVARLSFHKVVIYAHGEELTGWGKGNKYRAMCFALRHADTVIANSDFTRETLLGMGVAAERIALIHPGVDIERFQPGLACQDLRDQIGLTSDALLLLSVGRLSRRKGFDKVIECMPKLIREGLNVHYAIIGIGEDQAYLDELVSESGCQGRVHLLGHVAMDDLPRWYNACDVFVLANREINGDTEGFGMVFVEAAACGKPALAGAAGGTGSAVIDGETGLRVLADSAQPVFEALLSLLGDEGLRQRYGLAGLARAREQLSWPAVARLTAKLAVTGKEA